MEKMFSNKSQVRLLKIMNIIIHYHLMWLSKG